MITLEEYDVNEKDFETEASPADEYVPLERTIKPLLCVMKLFGLYHEPERTKVGVVVSSNSLVIDSGNVKTRRSVKSFTLNIYCSIVLILMFINLVRYIPAFVVGAKGTSLTVIRVIVFGWILNGFFNTAILFVSCHRGHLKTYFDYYNKISTDEIARKVGIRTDCVTLRYKVIVWTALAIVFSASNVGCVLYSVFTDMNGWMTIALINPLPPHYMAYGFMVVALTYCSIIWLLPVVFMIILCSFLQFHLKTVSTNLDTLIQREGRNAVKKLNDYRLKHLQYTKAICLMDLDFKYLYAEIYITAIWTCCFNLYQLVNTSGLGTFQLVLYISWLSSYFIIVLSTSVAAAFVNDEAHSPLEHVFEIDVHGITIEDSQCLNLFISKLMGPQMGFTTMGLLTITKEFMLSLAGLYVTYFFLLIQFKV